MKNYYSCERKDKYGNLVVLEAKRIARKTTKETKGTRRYEVTITTFDGGDGGDGGEEILKTELIATFANDESTENVENCFYRILRYSLNEDYCE